MMYPNGDLFHNLSIKINSDLGGGRYAGSEDLHFQGIDLHSSSCGGEVQSIKSMLDVTIGLLQNGNIVGKVKVSDREIESYPGPGETIQTFVEYPFNAEIEKSGQQDSDFPLTYRV